MFHPEISEDLTWPLYFLHMIKENHFKINIPKNINKTPLGPGTWSVKTAFPKFLKGGVIMDCVNGQQAKLAEDAGACAVMALERIPADIKRDGGIARMSDPRLIKEVM